MLPHWLAREFRTLFLSLCLWTFLHISIKLILWLLLKWPLDICMIPMDREKMRVHKKKTSCQASYSWTTTEITVALSFLMTFLLIWFFLFFIYFYMELWFQTHHYFTWRGYHFVYLHICICVCMQVTLCTVCTCTRFLETCGSCVSDRETSVF